MSVMTSNYATCAGYEIHFTEWGHGNSDLVVMWHGLARTGRDFDPCARHFAGRYRVICPDTIGRGLSQWARRDEDYCLDVYADIAAQLLDHVGAQGTIRWVGTSMGGALGIKLAAGALKGRISHLFVNDIAPELAKPAVERILTYAGNPATFETVSDLEAYLRTIYAPYGYLSDDQWRTMAETSARRTDGGGVTLHYDPAMVTQFVHHPNDYTQWDAYDAIAAKTMVYRGANSDLLLPEWANAMAERGPKAKVVEFGGCGHAPALNVPAQLDPLAAFLAE